MKTYPYKAWILQPLFKPVEVEFEKKYEAWGDRDYGDVTGSGKRIDRADIFESKASAIEAGFLRVAIQQAALDKKQNNIEKKLKSLWKAKA